MTKPPSDGCYVYGLYLDGARWNDKTQKLDEQNEGVLFSDVPHIWLIPHVPTETEEDNKNVNLNLNNRKILNFINV